MPRYYRIFHSFIYMITLKLLPDVKARTTQIKARVHSGITYPQLSTSFTKRITTDTKELLPSEGMALFQIAD